MSDKTRMQWIAEQMAEHGMYTQSAEVLAMVGRLAAVTAERETLKAECAAVKSAETEAWLIEYKDGKDVYRHNAIADFRGLDPNATSTELIRRQK